MHPRSKLTDRLQDQTNAKAAKTSLIAKMVASKLAAKKTSGAVAEATPHATQPNPAPPEPPKQGQPMEGAPAAPTSLRFGGAQVPVLKEGESEASIASHALGWLVDQYLDAATSRTRKIALLWPTAPKSLALVHSLATLERWTQGDKMGIRGMTFPVKTNVFHPLNHLRFSRAPLLRLALQLAETSTNAKVKRSCKAKRPHSLPGRVVRPDFSRNYVRSCRSVVRQARCVRTAQSSVTLLRRRTPCSRSTGE
jgi:hypothetical protein